MQDAFHWLLSSISQFNWDQYLFKSIIRSVIKRFFVETSFLILPYVIYWPSTKPSIKRCTCVNKRKNSRSRWALNNNITRCLGRFESVGDRMPKRENQLAYWGLWALSDPRLSNPKPRWERNAAMVKRRTWGQYSSLSPSPAHLSHTTAITLLRIKCERLYSYKEVCLFIYWSRHHIWLRSTYICICILIVYNIIIRFGAVTRIWDQSMVFLWFWDSSRNCRGPYCIWEDERCICIVLWCPHVRIANCVKNSMK